MREVNLTNSLLANQNKLIEQMNGLIERQNQILQNQPSIKDREVFVNDIDSDEMRDGFLVTSHKKKLWNVQIGLINEFARVCKKYNLRWFAFYGTLLGAARHKGFIPWDDDVDIILFRPDYNKFLSVAYKEIRYPYYVDNWYNYKRESDENPEETAGLPILPKLSDRSAPYAFPYFPVIKIRDSRTTQMEFLERKNVNQGVWIDIFPFDTVPPFSDEKSIVQFEVAKELLMAASIPQLLKNALESGKKFAVSANELKSLMKLPYRHRGMQYEKFVTDTYSESIGKFGNKHFHFFAKQPQPSHDLKSFEKTVYLPFEKIELPVPAGWEECLTTEYKDWRKPVYTHTHAADYSADIPYTEYYKTSALMK